MRRRVPATGIMRTLQVGDRPTRLAQAIAEFGRIDKTLHTLTYLDDEAKRRGTLTQLKGDESRDQNDTNPHSGNTRLPERIVKLIFA